jgi:mRNA interferase RelE/StbE
MYDIFLEKRVSKSIGSYPEKHQKQIKEKILSLRENATPQDSKHLKGFEDFLSCDTGEYRIIYRFDSQAIYIVLVGKRNGGEVYEKLKRLR